MAIILKGTVKGNLQSKANSRKLVMNRKTGRVLFIKSQSARDFSDEAISQLKRLWMQKPAYTGLVSLRADIYYSSRRPDLTPELFMDCLEKSGVIFNDRQVFEFDRIRKRLDPQNPRIEFILSEYEEKN